MQSIETMTVMELADFVKALEDKFGVSAAAPVAVAAAGGAAAGAAPAKEESAEDKKEEEESGMAGLGALFG